MLCISDKSYPENLEKIVWESQTSRDHDDIIYPRSRDPLLHYHVNNAKVASSRFFAHLPDLIYYYIVTWCVIRSKRKRTRTCHAQQWPTPNKWINSIHTKSWWHTATVDGFLFPDFMYIIDTLTRINSTWGSKARLANQSRILLYDEWASGWPGFAGKCFKNSGMSGAFMTLSPGQKTCGPVRLLLGQGGRIPADEEPGMAAGGSIVPRRASWLEEPDHTSINWPPLRQYQLASPFRCASATALWTVQRLLLAAIALLAGVTCRLGITPDNLIKSGVLRENEVRTPATCSPQPFCFSGVMVMTGRADPFAFIRRFVSVTHEA